MKYINPYTLAVIHYIPFHPNKTYPSILTIDQPYIPPIFPAMPVPSARQHSRNRLQLGHGHFRGLRRCLSLALLDRAFWWRCM